ncbi:intermembrane phospholipid transport protein YdbH family protein [Planctobacterium marinum]|uniref:intermembrane phospholipid transport protein YdbH family protein n=1 Tax=Planctobacterium marinum TaxID=1631968 RepID=UPI001E31BD88|nr:YdbH domain-containing protein [Planctobacterium marinum]MCC2607695.1 YdbH domain-containing protein [Planctobacterium marinum]
MNKATGIKAVFITLLLVLVAGYFYLPGVIHQQLAASVKQFDAELQCLDWQLKSVKQLYIKHLCLQYQGITMEVHDAQVGFSVTALLSGNPAHETLQKIQVKQLLLQVPTDKLYTQSESNSASAVEGVIPWLRLPNINVSQFQLQFTGETNQSSGSNSSLFSWQISTRSDADNNHIRFTNLIQASDWLQLTQHKSSDVALAWQLSLAELFTMAEGLPLPVLNSHLSPVKSLSGIWTGNIKLDPTNLEQLSAHNEIRSLSATFALAENEGKPLSLQGDVGFSIDKNNQNWQLSGITQQPLIVGGLAQWSTAPVESLRWQDWQLQNPVSEFVQVTLPETIFIAGLAEIQVSAPVLLHSGGWQAQLQSINANLQQQTLNGQVSVEGNLVLQKNAQQLPVQFILAGSLDLSPARQQVKLSQWQVISSDWAKMIAVDLPLQAGALQVSGYSDISLQAEKWQVDGQYHASIDTIKASVADEYSLSIRQLSLSGDYQLSPDSLVSENRIQLNDKLRSALSTRGDLQNLSLHYELRPSPLHPWLKLIAGIPDKLKIQGGMVSAEVNAHLLNGRLSPVGIQMVLNEFSASYDNYLLSNAQTQFKGVLSPDGKLISDMQNLQVERFFAGVNLDDIALSYRLSPDTQTPDGLTNPVIESFSASLLGGNVGFTTPFYPLNSENQLSLAVERLSVPELVTLFEQPGLEVTGALSGAIPVIFSEGSVSVRQAKLNAVENGVIQIKDNPAFINLKHSQQSLAAALGLLENLQYSQLQTTMSLQTDGWLELAVNIKGVNPEQQQPINFNPTFSTNLYTGLKALRAGKDISKAIEQRF